MLVKTPRWKRENIGYIDPAEPLTIRNGREHYLIHLDNQGYDDEYVDCLYMDKMEDVSKSKRTQYSPDEVWISSEQRVALKGLRKSRALGRRLFKESSSPQWRIVEEDDTLELSKDPFAEVPLEETGQKRSPKPLPQQRRQAAQKRSPKPLTQERVGLQPAQKRSPKPPPQERLRLQAAQERSPQPPLQERLRLQAAQKRSPKATAKRKTKTTGSTEKIIASR